MDTTEFVTNLLAVGAVAIQALLLAAALALGASRFSPGLRERLGSARESARTLLLPAAAALAAIATAGSLFYSEYANYVPCGLCWYQRIAMYPLVVVLGIAAVRRDAAGAVRYGLPLTAIGAAVSILHIYIEYNPEAEVGVCKAGAATSCTIKWIEEFGYITIPALALTAFAAIAVLLVLARGRGAETGPGGAER